MNRCLITYLPIPEEQTYSPVGLKKLSRSLRQLSPLMLSAQEQREESLARAGKMSIQGMQPKLSAVLNVKQGRFDIVDRNGAYILKPQSLDYQFLPENEDVTMRLAKIVGLQVPLHGLLLSKDGTRTYFIKRFDRVGRDKVSVEDFAQLMGANRETKYSSSMEQVASIVERFCTFPIKEKAILFRMLLFSFLVGNEDLHLKNFSLIRNGSVIEISPMYDLLSSTLALKNPIEELALPIQGKRAKLTREDLFERFAINRLQLTNKTINTIKHDIEDSINKWNETLDNCFLPNKTKEEYKALIKARASRVL